MERFETIEEVDAWLAPMNYEEFWRAVRPYCLVIPPREDCDAQIGNGVAKFDDVLAGLKVLACLELTKRHGLKHEPIGPVLQVVASND